MAPQAGSPAQTLRSITYRISSTPVRHLPHLIPQLTNTLPICKPLLSSPQTASSKDASDSAVALHKFKTQLSSLLQDKTVEGRWAAIILVKATIELGAWEVLRDSGPWVRGLLGILSKPDPPASKKLCIITLTRIFMLTRDYQTLVREITTPSLPSFVQSCLNILLPKGSLNPLQTAAQRTILQPVLESFGLLVPRHPTIFRSYQNQILQLLTHVLAPTPSSMDKGTAYTVPTEICEAARQLFVGLHHCAPKSTSTAEDWERMLKTTVANVHATADKVFRGVVEDWDSVAAVVPNAKTCAVDREVSQDGPDDMGLPGWSGFYAASERMVGLLGLLKQFIISPTSSSVPFRLGLIMDLLTRILSLTIPSSTDSVRINDQIGKEEREALWTVLPQIHIATIDVFVALIERFDSSLIPVSQTILDHVLWVFEAEKALPPLRAAIYAVVSQLLRLIGPSLNKIFVDSLTPIIRSCCNDLLPPEHLQSSAMMQGKGSANEDTFLNPTPKAAQETSIPEDLQAAAYTFLPAIFSNLPAQHISKPLRAQMDRTAILTQHKDAMLASVLNPPVKKIGRPGSSILPILARCYPDAIEVDGLLKPRMPVIRSGAGDMTDALAESDEEGDKELLPDSPPSDDFNQLMDPAEEAALPSRATAPEAPQYKLGALSATTQRSRMSSTSPSASGTPAPASADSSSEVPSKRLLSEAIIPASPIKRARTASPAPSAPPPVVSAQQTSIGQTSMRSTVTAAAVNVRASSSGQESQEDVTMANAPGDEDSDDQDVELTLEQDTEEEDEA